MTEQIVLPLVKNENHWNGVSLREGRNAEVSRYPWRVRCPAPFCYFQRSAKTNEEAHELLDTHKCPHYGGTTTYGWGMTVTLLEKIWAEVDARMNEIMDSSLPEDVKTLSKSYLRGVAYTLAIFMSPHFTTPDQIAAEAKRRWDARQAGDEEYETAGLAQLRFKPPPGDETTYQPPVRTAKKVTEPRTSKPKIDADAKARIVAAVAAGMPLDVISAAYKISEADIKTITESVA